MRSAQILRQKIDAGTLTIGALVIQHLWPGIIEIAIKAGLDYLILDQEHYSPSADVMAECCAIARMQNFPVLIRPPQAEMTPLRLAMDLGPCGLLIPCVQGINTMEAIQDAVYMPPRGKRRPGGPGIFWLTDYDYNSWKTEVEDDLIILPQIENSVGLENVEAIAAHPLTTAIAIGPYDLSAELGVCWNPEHPRLQHATERIRNAGRAAGKNMWNIGDGASLVKAGFTFICVAEPTMLMLSSLTTLVSDVKNEAITEQLPIVSATEEMV